MKYNVVFHLNLLEHVPDKIRLLEICLSLLGKNGVLLFSFPTLTYWKFWGYPKYLACKIFKKPFLIHGYSSDIINSFLSSHDIAFYYDTLGFHLPRRVYYFIPNMLLSTIAKIFDKIEFFLKSIGFTAPLMSVFYVVSFDKDLVKKLQVERPVNKDSRLWMKMLLFLALFPIILFAYVLMTYEVLLGRKTFFKQD